MPKGTVCVGAEANRAFSHDVTQAISVFQNNEMVAILVFQTKQTCGS